MSKQEVLLLVLRAAVIVALIGAGAWICVIAFGPDLAALFRGR
jgi:hypothetical protein